MVVIGQEPGLRLRALANHPIRGTVHISTDASSPRAAQHIRFAWKSSPAVSATTPYMPPCRNPVCRGGRAAELSCALCPRETTALLSSPNARLIPRLRAMGAPLLNVSRRFCSHLRSQARVFASASQHTGRASSPGSARTRAHLRSTASAASPPAVDADRPNAVRRPRLRPCQHGGFMLEGFRGCNAASSARRAGRGATRDCTLDRFMNTKVAG